MCGGIETQLLGLTEYITISANIPYSWQKRNVLG